MDEFDDAGKGDMAGAGISTKFGGQEQQGRTDALAPAGQDVLPHLSYQGDIGLKVLLELTLYIL